MTQQFCANCGEPLKENAQFCSSCGAQVNTSARPRRKKSSGKPQVGFPWYLVVGGALLLIAGIWSITSSRTPDALPTATAAVQQPTQVSEIPYPTVPRADVADVQAGLDAGTAIVVDVRDLEYYQEAHIPGAISMPADELEAAYQSLPQDQMVYLYCT